MKIYLLLTLPLLLAGCNTSNPARYPWKAPAQEEIFIINADGELEAIKQPNLSGKVLHPFTDKKDYGPDVFPERYRMR